MRGGPVPRNIGTKMTESKSANQKTFGTRKARETASADSRVAVVENTRRGSKAWLFGAYTFLLLWGVAYLVLFFTNRLPF